MSGRIKFSVLLLVSFSVSFYLKAGSLSGSSQPEKRDTAIQWFNEGKFVSALPLFARLCYDAPYDFLIKYYYGACLVETGNFGLDAEKNLILASSSEVPSKVNYYLGRLFHGKSNWNNALRFYNRFKNNAEATEIANTKVDDLIQLCYDEVNPFIAEKADSLMYSGNAKIGSNKDSVNSLFIVPVTNDADTTVRSIPAIKSDTLKISEKDSQPDDTLKNLQTVDTTTVNKEVKTDIPVTEGPGNEQKQNNPEPVKFIDFQINDKVTYLVEEMFHVVEAKLEFRIAVSKESQLDSLLKVVQLLRKQYHLNVNPLVRDSLAIRIQNLEYQNLVLNTEVDQHYFKSRKLEQEWWNNAENSNLEEYISWKDSLIQWKNAQFQQKIQQLTLSVPDSINTKVPLDSLAVTSEVKPDTAVVYKIQIGAFGKIIPVQRKQQFERLEKIRTIESFKTEDGVTIYTTGNLKDYNDALKLQAQIKLEGIKDAIIIAFRNGVQITLPTDNSLK
jgi:hypothetical protein